ncbi:MAG: VTT domain-containing protein [Acetobacteraceae bacterium]
MHVFIDWAIAFARAHASLAYALAFLFASSESLPVVGALIPGTTAIIAIGTLIATGAIQYWPFAAAAALGAMLGDGISYVIGYRSKDALRARWPLANHPQLLQRGEALFRRHGTLSIVISRFTPGVRNIVPILAGILRLRPLRFFGTDIPTALVWAFSHVFFGVLLGASLELLGAIAGKLAALAGLLVVLVYLVVVASRALARLLPAALAAMVEPLRRLAARHPGGLGSGLTRILAAERTQALGLGIAAVLVAAGLWVLVAALSGVVHDDPLARLDGVVLNAFIALRNGPADSVMRALAASASVAALGAIGSAVLVVLVIERQWPSLFAWILGLGGAAVLGFLLRVLPHGAIPPETAASALLHNPGAMLAATLYGLLGFFLFRAVRPRFQVAIASAAGLVIAAGAIARLYLGLSVLSTEIVAVAFGFTWVGIAAGVAVVRRLPSARGWPIALVAVPLLVGAMGAQAAGYGLVQPTPPPLRTPTQFIPLAAWRIGGWDTLPGSRVGLLGNYTRPFVLQWAGTAGALAHVLEADGWRAPPPWTVRTALNWLEPGIDPASLPVLPRFAFGRPEALALVLPQAGVGPPRRMLLRLWPSDSEVAAGNHTVPLWLGSLFEQRFTRVAATLAVAHTVPAGPASVTRLAAALGATEMVFDPDATVGKEARRGARSVVLLGWDPAALAPSGAPTHPRATSRNEP